MQYLLMNRNSLEGYQKGYFEELPPCFYEAVSYEETAHGMLPRYMWTPVMGLAHRFSTEDQAWDFSKATWGLKFAFNNHMVMAVHRDALDRSYSQQNLIMETRYSNG
jgi:hypothetical protein